MGGFVKRREGRNVIIITNKMVSLPIILNNNHETEYKEF